MIYVIGIGIEGRCGLPPATIGIIKRAGLIAGGRRHLKEFPGLSSAKVPLEGGLEAAVSKIEGFATKRSGDVAVLATGDPLLYGVAAFIIKRFGKSRVKVVPNVSTIQEAFARIKESANGVKVLSVHGRSADLEKTIRDIISNERTAVFTDPENPPSKVAKALLESTAAPYRAFLCESLGTEKERVAGLTLKQLARKKRFSPLNVLVLIRKEGVEGARVPGMPPGIPDDRFSRSNGMITKEELRVISLSKLRLANTSLVWDIGSGSGSVAIEAARLTVNRVYAIEKDRLRVRDIVENKKRFNCPNLSIVSGAAPRALKGLPRPDAVFVGGGGSSIKGILRYSSARLKKGGRLVVNAVTMETASKANEFFASIGWERELLLVNISKARPVADLSLLSAHNPIFIIRGVKP